MATLNLVLALIALVGAYFVGRSYIPHIPLMRAGVPAAWLARAFVVASCAYFLRTAYWDVLWPFLGGMAVATPLVNVIINAAIVVAEYCALRARLEAIPEDERDRYNIFTVCRHPPGHRLFKLR